MSKDEWFEINEYLEERLGREPTEAEINEEYSVRCSDAYKSFKERFWSKEV